MATTTAAARAPLWNRGFVSLLATQFFEAATDNLVKTALTLAVAAGKPWEPVLGKGGGGIVAIAFTVPFILLSAWAGRLADRFSKRSVTVVLKSASFAVAALVAVAFARGQPWTAFASLVLFSTVSAFFGPAKYGMIPELVAPAEVARANGVVNMATNLAVIFGTLLAGVVSDRWDASIADGVPSGPGAWAPGLAVGALVVLGFATCLTLPRLAPQAPGLPVQLNPFATYVATLREMAAGPLLATALYWSFFYLLAAVMLLVLPDYGAWLGTGNSEVAALIGLLGVSIGVGCVAAAWLDRPQRRPHFVPGGALALAVVLAGLGFSPPDYWPVGAWLAATGLAAGFYIIPLQSALQQLAPDASRGRVLGTSNGLSFVMAAVGGAAFLAMRRMDIPSNRVPAVLAVACVVVAIAARRWLRRQPSLASSSA